MTDRVNEQLSALADEALSRQERDLLVARMARDASLRDHWDRYHLISDAIRGHLPVQVAPGLYQRVANALDSEAPHDRHGSRSRDAGRWLRPVAGLAVAASVAMVAVFVLRPPEPGTPVQVAQVETPPADSDYRRLEGTSWRDQQGQQVGDRLNQYLVNHNEFAVRNGMPAITPHVRIVGYDSSSR